MNPFLIVIASIFFFLNLPSSKSEKKWMLISNEVEADPENKTYCLSKPWKAMENIFFLWVKG